MKNWHFLKGLTHGFGPKMAIFPIFFFLGNIDQENVFYDIFELKNAFLGTKSRSWKSRKIDVFLKGLTHGFGSKIAIFPTVLGGGEVQYRPGTCLLLYSRTNKCLSRL